MLSHLGFGSADLPASRALHAAFVIDPDGHNIEAVCHAPGTAEDQT